jgi:hypothetical protein
MTTWNHRVIDHGEFDDHGIYGVGRYLAIHEVYYDADGKPKMMTEAPISIAGETLEELGETLDRMKRALEEPVLPVEQFEPKGGGPR